MDAAAYIASAHEAAHAVAAYLYGWDVTRVVRRKDGSGETNQTPPTDGNLVERAIESVVVTLMGKLEVPASDAVSDLAKVDGMSNLRPDVVAEGWKRAHAMRLNPRYRALHAALDRELLSHPEMDAGDVFRVLYRADPQLHS